MKEEIKSFSYAVDGSWHESLSDYASLTLSLNKDENVDAPYWEVHAYDENGDLAQDDPVLAFSTDTITKMKTVTPELQQSESFANTFARYVKKQGVDYAYKIYGIIPRTKDVSFPELLGLSKEEIQKIRAGIEGKVESYDDIADVAEKAFSKVLSMISIGQNEIPDGPVEVEERVDSDGMRAFYIKGTNVLHRDVGPAAIGKNRAKMWMQRGVLHRDDGPAIEFPDGRAEAWWQNGIIHRTDGPALIDENGDEQYVVYGAFMPKEIVLDANEQGLVPKQTDTSVIWTKDDKPHNERGPAIFTHGASYYAREGLLHREDGPAAVYSDGKVAYYLHGFAIKEDDWDSIQDQKLQIGKRDEAEDNYRLTFRDERNYYHREGGPAVISTDGTREWHSHGWLHRLDGPAVIMPDKTERYYIRGREFTKEEVESIATQNLVSHRLVDSSIEFYKRGTSFLHNETGPARISKQEKGWYRDGSLHREDGPALVYSDGKEEYWLNGSRHREGGPAIVYANGVREYYKDGVLHRRDGPAVDSPVGVAQYWIDGLLLSKQEFDDLVAQDLDVEQGEAGAIVFSRVSDGMYHRIGGPAIRRAAGPNEWFYAGLRHREDGPAIVRPDGTETYYLADKVVTKEQHKAIMQDGESINVNGLVLKQYEDKTMEWLPAPEEDLIVKIKPLDADISIDIRADDSINLQGEDVFFQTDEGTVSIKEIVKELKDLREKSDQKSDSDLGVDLEDLDLDSFLKAAEEVMTESLDLAIKAASLGVIVNNPANIMEYAKQVRELPEKNRIKLKESLEKDEAKKLSKEFLDEATDERSTKEDVFKRHEARRQKHLEEILSPPEGVEEPSDGTEPSEEGIGLLPTIAGAALIALAGAAVSNKKSAAVSKKKQEKEEQAAVYN